MTILLILSCETTKETYNEFVLEGETVYVGKADSVLIGEGYNKLRFWVAINADPKISKGILKTNDETVFHEFEVSRSKSGKDTISFDLDLDEGEYTFGLFLMDENENQSVRVEVPARVYGEKYKSGLINRGIAKIEAYADKALIHWASASESILETRLTYEDVEGNMQELAIPNEVTQTTLEDYKRGGMLSLKSTYRPTITAIEDFEANPTQSSFPDEFMLDKSKIAALRLPGDASGGCYGSSYERLFDGSVSTGYWHSCDDPADKYPWVMSFDLGSAQAVSRFGLDERPECCGERSPGNYQIWATNDLANATTTDIDDISLEEWEEEAAAKGWVKLLDVNGNTQKSFKQSIQENGSKYRYVRIVGISSIGGGSEANFNEFTFWGK
ncbi:hypothetical protein GCM10028791_20340 [Echinicola sediminis]